MLATRNKLTAGYTSAEGGGVTTRGRGGGRTRRSNSFSGISHFTVRSSSSKMSQSTTTTATLGTAPSGSGRRDGGAISPSDPSNNQKRFPFLPRFNNKESPGGGNKKKSKDESQLCLAKMSAGKLRHWATSFDNLLSDPIGIQLFEEFLRKECSQENIQFWKDCQRFQFCSHDKLQSEAERIFAEYISHDAPNLVNIDHTVRDEVVSNMSQITNHTFDKASFSIYMLMQRDSYSRFVKQPEFKVATS